MISSIIHCFNSTSVGLNVIVRLFHSQGFRGYKLTAQAESSDSQYYTPYNSVFLLYLLTIIIWDGYLGVVISVVIERCHIFFFKLKNANPTIVSGRVPRP